MFFFFFNDPATTEIYTLPLHDALPICFEQRLKASMKSIECEPRPRVIAVAHRGDQRRIDGRVGVVRCARPAVQRDRDRKSTRLNSSHLVISYADFCLKNKRPLARSLRR